MTRLIGTRALRIHSLVIAELAMGNLRPWRATIDRLRALPQVRMLSDDLLYRFIEDRELAGTGLSFVDAHLLASAEDSGLSLWTGDKRLQKQAKRIGIALID